MLLSSGRAAFNRGDYFQAHELWEDVWRGLEGGERIFVQGLIQIAAGLHHLQQGRRRPAAGLLRKGLAKLAAETPTPFAELRIDPLTRAVAGVLVQLNAFGTATTETAAAGLSAIQV
jgi:predicted metal-dependent hydrolase